MFSLSVFALMGLQIYMGVLTQKCIRKFPEDGSYPNATWDDMERWFNNESKILKNIKLSSHVNLTLFIIFQPTGMRTRKRVKFHYAEIHRVRDSVMKIIYV